MSVEKTRSTGGNFHININQLNQALLLSSSLTLCFTLFRERTLIHQNPLNWDFVRCETAVQSGSVVLSQEKRSRMFLVPWILILLAVPLRGYDVMMVIGGRYYDHARQAYIELSTVEVDHLFTKYSPTYSKFHDLCFLRYWLGPSEKDHHYASYSAHVLWQYMKSGNPYNVNCF